MKTVVILITHEDDNDGVFGAIMAEEYVKIVLEPVNYNSSETIVIPLNNAGDVKLIKTFNTKIKNSVNFGDHVIVAVTDIGLQDSTHKYIRNVIDEYDDNSTMIYVDHHESANMEVINQVYDIVKVDTAQCATLNLYLMIERFLSEEKERFGELEEFTQKYYWICHYVNDRDLFIKQHKESDDLFLLYTALKFDKMYYAYRNEFDGRTIIPAQYNILLEYILKTRRETIIKYFDDIDGGGIFNICGFKVGHVLDRGFFSDGAEAILEKFKHIDIVFCINVFDKQVSLRCRKTDKRFKLGLMAHKINKGGGHFAAAGYPCDEIANMITPMYAQVYKQLSHALMHDIL